MRDFLFLSIFLTHTVAYNPFLYVFLQTYHGFRLFLLPPENKQRFYDYS
ncbi:hypothetical protein TFKS16_0344 [Tannerella forsythia KS16]|nr:hypothetical protein TFKS16_0344 [Tannerella forsythia KS16]